MSAWDINLDLLYWQVQENGLAYATDERAINPDFEWDPGFRIGIGYKFRWDGWVAFLSFTHFHSHASGDHEGELVPRFANLNFLEADSFVDQAAYHWRLHFGEFDLVLKKRIQASPQVDFTPYFGVRVACIRQKYRILYFGGNLFPNSEDLVTTKNKFLGTGLVMGASAEWKLGKGWGLYAEATAALLYGEFYVHQGEYADIGVEKRLSLHRTFYATAPILDLVFGVQWNRGIWDLHLAWEEHDFFSQNQWEMFTSFISNSGDLSLQGVVLGAGVTF